MRVKLFSAAVILSICFSSSIMNAQSELEGTWKAVYHEVVTPDTTITASGSEASNLVKIINKTHFATILQGDTPNTSFFNGGKYELTKDTYTENLEYFSTKDEIGKSYTFKSSFKDGEWTISGPISKGGAKLPEWKIREVYKKVD